MLKSEIKVLIADDHPIMLNGLKVELMEIGYTQVFTASDGIKAFDMIATSQYDVAILDIVMPGLDAFEIAQKCKKINENTPLIFFSYHKDKSYLSYAKKIGIMGYMLKEDSMNDLNDCIMNVIQNKMFYSKSIELDLLEDLNTELTLFNDLTSAEKSILVLIAQGLNSTQISAQKEISVRTVEKHRSNIISKILLEPGQSLNQWSQVNKKLILNL